MSPLSMLVIVLLAEFIVLLVKVAVSFAVIPNSPPFIVALAPKSILSKASITPADAPVPSKNSSLALPLFTLTVAPEPCLIVIT